MSSTLSEHIEYITLPGRNAHYQAALHDCIESGDVVADLGCGVGVLGVLALNAGAGKVYGIDNSSAITLAQDTMKRSGLQDVYECIADTTFAVELPEPVDALICDHVGFFGIDYGIVDMLRDAALRMLKPDGQIMPQSLKLYACGVSSAECFDKAAAWSQDVVPPEFRWLDEQSRNSKFSHDFQESELCSNPELLGKISLGPNTLEFFDFSVDLIATRSGELHGLAGWFDAQLAQDVWMTNSPIEDRSIRRTQAYFPVAKPFEVSAGDAVRVRMQARSDGEFFAWSFEPPNGDMQRMTTWRSVILSPNDAKLTDGHARVLNNSGKARQFILSLVDGERSAGEIERIVLDKRPDLFPSAEATSRFVRSVLNSDSKV